MDNLTADHSGMRLGRAPMKPEHEKLGHNLSTFLTAELPDPPAVINVLGSRGPLSMLGNDRFGCCMFVAMANHAQAVSAAMGRERVWTEAEVLEAYSLCTGFDQNNPDTDQGANMFEALTWWKKTSYFGEIEGFARIDPSDWKKSRRGMWLLGGVLNGLDLPIIAQRQNVWRAELGVPAEQMEPGGWGGHATASHVSGLDEHGHPVDEHETWGGFKLERHTFRDSGCHAEGYVVLVKDYEPPDVPGFQRDQMLSVMRAVQA